ncbi:MAG: M56 family metallopeptidase, partial [Alphaproteobacteria bacterium]|nr:M56 family metallopeptidase [Alphaproteobacteria bacterium]
PLSSPVSLLNIELARFFPSAEPDAAAIAATVHPSPETMDALLTAQPAFTAAPASAVDAAPFAAASFPDEMWAMALMAGAAAWVAGALYVAGRNILAHRSFMQTVEREAMPVSARMSDLVTRIAADTGLRRPPRIVASLISRGPFVTGLLRAVVVMPAWFEDDYTPVEARAALAHELMHVRRGDLWALQLSELFVAAMWFNPLAYIARDAFRTDQEAACDADVLSRCETSPHTYGSTLVKAARLHLPEPVMAAARLPLTHALKERLTRMAYPTPSSRRRLIGFGAALLFGASTLAITASVAAASEPETTETHEFRIETGGLWVSGEDSDRQIVLLGDPMAKVMPVPSVPPEVANLERQIQIDVAETTGPEMMGPIMQWHESADWKEFEDLAEELAGLHQEMAEETVSEDGKTRVVKRIRLKGDMTPEQHAALVAKLEAKAAAIEARMAAREAELGAHEANVESKMIVLERRIEENGAEIERIMEERFGDDFEARIEAQAQVVEDLVEACEVAELATGETKVIERKDADGETFRLACIEGDRANMKSESALAIVRNHPGITDAEKAAFRAAAEGERRKNVMIFRSGGDEMEIDIDMDVEVPEPPAAPETPETPAAPETPLKGG